MAIQVKATDVIDVMIDGLASDNAVSGNIRIVADNPSVFDASTDTVSLATNGITSSTLATSAVTEIQSGLSTFNPASQNVTVGGIVASGVADLFEVDSMLRWQNAVRGSPVSEVLNGYNPADIQAAVALEVWSHYHRTLTNPSGEAAPVITKTLIIYRDASITINLTDLGDISNRSKLWFTLKRDPLDPDSEALIQIEETAGLLYISGQAVPITGVVAATDGDITISDQVVGNISIVLKPVAAVLLSTADNLWYDAKTKRTTSGDVDPLAIGRLHLRPTVTRAIS